MWTRYIIDTHMQTYNKLIRDKIPEIIKGKGEACVTHVATEEEYEKQLLAKLAEEVKEYQDVAGTGSAIEELADIMEVMVAILDFKKIDCGELERVRLEKREKRGGFEKRLILEQS